MIEGRKMQGDQENRKIVFFDGVCHACHFAVKVILRFDRKKVFYFAPLQGELASRLTGARAKELDTLVVYAFGVTRVKSEALFYIAKNLGGVFWLLMPFKILPRFLTDGVYDLFAKYRYRVFGKFDSCVLPSKADLERFLD